MVGLVDRLSQRSGKAAGREDDDKLLVRFDRQRPPAKRELELAEAAWIRSAGRRVDQAAARGADLDEPELGDVTRDRRLDGLVPGVAQRVGELGLGRDRTLADQPEDC